MTIRLPAEFISQIKLRLSAYDVIGSYVSLKRAGSNYVGLCPFHGEKTPSFTVFPKSENFYCFGCGSGGDIITFIMKAENLDYISAVELLANRCGLAMPVGDDVLRESVRRKRILEINKQAAIFYRNILSSGRYPHAVEYIRSRQLDGLASKKFGLGYAPDDYGILAAHLSDLGYTSEETEAAFLCRRAKNGSMFDLYRNRIIFPIIDTLGNVIAFGGRAMGDVKPKYLNTNDTLAFKKSKNLFSLNYAKNSPDDFFILCEGYVDVISLYAAGFTSAVASLGTSLTEEQAYIMKKYKNKVVICYDGDEAGKKATKRAIPILLNAGLEIKVLSIPGSLDPDEYIKKYGAERFGNLLGQSSGEFEYRSEEILSSHDLNDTEQKLRAIEEICSLLATVSSEVRREVYISRLALRLDIPTDALKNDVERIRRSVKKRNEREENRIILQKTAGYSDTVNPDASKNIAACRAEEAVLGLMLTDCAYIKREVDGKNVCEDDFFTSFNKRVFAQMLSIMNEEGSFDPGSLGAELSADEMGRVTGMKLTRSGLSNNSPPVFDECVRAMRKHTQEMNRPSDGSIDDILSIIKSKSDINRSGQT